jgi:transposase-like protein
MCVSCGRRSSVTAGTIFDRTRTPLTVWFTACWLLCTGKDGISALSLKRTLEIGSYQTAWAMLHRLRSVLVRPGRDRLGGSVEVDETYIGGEQAGLRGGRARGKKVLTGIAVEVQEPKGLGRCRMRPLADASSESLEAFVKDHIQRGARVITDGWQGYRGLEKLGYIHERRNQAAARAEGEDPNELLPGVHRVASLAKRWLLGTHQGSVENAHLASYLDEFVFRFNRRRSRSRGMLFYRLLELAVVHAPVRYQDIIITRRPRAVPPAPPKTRGNPPSMDRPQANRPWRRGERHDSG